MKKGILLVIYLSFNTVIFAANDFQLGQFLLLGTILDQFAPRRNHAIVVPQLLRARDVREQAQERHKTLKRNQPQYQRYHKRQQ